MQSGDWKCMVKIWNKIFRFEKKKRKGGNINKNQAQKQDTADIEIKYHMVTLEPN